MILPLGPDSLGQRAGVPPASKRAIDENPAGLGGKPVEHFGKHYGHMNGIGSGHGFERAHIKIQLYYPTVFCTRAQSSW